MSTYYSIDSSFESRLMEVDQMEIEPTKKEWRAVLVEGQCQSGKTFRVIQLLKEKIDADSGTLILMVTQANSGSSADQTLERMQTDLTSIVDIQNMSKASTAPVTFEPIKNQLIVDFWHIRNTDIMLECAKNFKRVVVVVDEADQGGMTGIMARMQFVKNVERVVPDCKLFLVTATTANLSKAILRMSESAARFDRDSIIHDIVFEESVEYQNVKPSDDYVGTSLMLKGDVRYLKFRSKRAIPDEYEYNEHKNNVIFKMINELPTEKKELTMVAISSRTEEHANMVHPLMNSGYNVVVLMNSTNNKNYNVSYKVDGRIKTWKIPTKEIYQLADDNGLSRLDTIDDTYETGIVKKENIRLPDILQSALFMGTTKMATIRQNVSKRTFIKLRAINIAMMNTCGKLNRPRQYPSDPKVALVVGNLASRGITFQDPFIDLICTSFVFTDVSDTLERGARNTQKLGRFSGNLFFKYTEERKPVVIATRKIVESALANYNAVYENSKNLKNGELIALRHYISDTEWKEFKSDAKDTVKASIDEVIIDEDTMIAKMKKYMDPNNKTTLSTIFKHLYKHTKDGSFMNIRDLVQNTGYTKGEGAFRNFIKNGGTGGAQYGVLWEMCRDTIRFNQCNIKYMPK